MSEDRSTKPEAGSEAEEVPREVSDDEAALGVHSKQVVVYNGNEQDRRDFLRGVAKVIGVGLAKYPASE